MVNDAGMSTFKAPKSVLVSTLATLLFSAAMAIPSVTAGVARAADPMPAPPKAEAPKAEAKAQTPSAEAKAEAPRADVPKTAAKESKTKSAASGKVKSASGSEVTLKGDMTCAKCGLHEASKCQNVLKVKDAAGKEVKYYLAKNSVSDDHHEKVCSGSSPATVTGKVSDEGGKKMMTASEVKYE